MLYTNTVQTKNIQCLLVHVRHASGRRVSPGLRATQLMALIVSKPSGDVTVFDLGLMPVSDMKVSNSSF